jgi:hypothetical protein
MAELRKQARLSGKDSAVWISPTATMSWPQRSCSAVTPKAETAGSLEISTAATRQAGITRQPQAKAGARGITVSGQGFTRLVAQSARRADDRVMTGPPWARNASGRTSFSPARSCAAVHGTAMCPSDTDIDGMFAGFSGKAPPFDPVTRRIDSTLAGESLRHKGADYATRRRELPTFVWSVVPPGLDSPPPRIKPRSGPLLRQRGKPPDHRKPGRRAAASRREEQRAVDHSARRGEGRVAWKPRTRTPARPTAAAPPQR